MRVRSLFRGAVLALPCLAWSPAAWAVGDPPPLLEREADYELARSLIREKRYAEALAPLDRLRKDFARQAEVHSLTGFVLRKTGRLDEAFAHYREALTLDPTHRGANEYLGELFVQTGHIDLAKQQLSILQSLCPSGCEEAEDLDQAITAAVGK